MINHPIIRPASTATATAAAEHDPHRHDDERSQLVADLEATLQRLLDLTAMCEEWVAA